MSLWRLITAKGTGQHGPVIRHPVVVRIAKAAYAETGEPQDDTRGSDA